ncbi:MAG: hypothetical protein ACJ8AW_06495 [Rhodopila sp.]|jgi:hypothetical protein
MTRRANTTRHHCCKVTTANSEPYLKKPVDACDLDREADALLHLGHRRQAERLAHLAEKIRGVAI